MKKLISLTLALALCLGLTACGGNSDPADDTAQPSSTPTDSAPAEPELKLNADSASIPVGVTFQLSGEVTGAEPGDSLVLSFRSSDSAIATVNEDGVITGVAPGTAVITVETSEDLGLSAECEVLVKEDAQTGDEQPVLTLNSTDFTLKSAGASWRLRYTCEPDMDAIPEFTSSDESIATVAEDGTVTAVAPGRAVITLTYGDLTAECIVRCRWEESQTPETPAPSETPSSGSVDLTAFADKVMSNYEFSFLELASTELMDGYYTGLSGVDTEQCLVYLTMMTMNNGEFCLIQVNNKDDVSRVKSILQGRIDYMVGDGNRPGGAWYPGPTEQWKNNSRVVSNGNYVMMVVHEECDAIVDEFNALF